MKDDKAVAKKEKHLVIDWLIENFPNAFFKKPQQIKALEIGIFDQLMEFYQRLDQPPWSKKVLREAFTWYTNSPAYLSCQKKGAARVDLYGNETGEVTEDQASYAHQKCILRYAK